MSLNLCKDLLPVYILQNHILFVHNRNSIYNNTRRLLFHSPMCIQLCWLWKWLTNKIGRNARVHLDTVSEFLIYIKKMRRWKKKIDCDVRLPFKVNYIWVICVNWILTNTHPWHTFITCKEEWMVRKELVLMRDSINEIDDDSFRISKHQI